MPNVDVNPLWPARSTHDISFSDGTETWGAMLEGGPRGIRETPVTPSTLLVNRATGKFSDQEPDTAHMEQRDWTGGRGQEEFANDNTQFFDSGGLWTLTPDRLTHAPQWRLPDLGGPATRLNLPGSVTWRKLIGSERYLAVTFTPGATFSSLSAYLWIRRRGKPGTLTAELWSDNAGSPNAMLKSATVTTSTVTDVLSLFYGFTWTSQSLTGGTAYWVVIYGASTDTAANSWEVGTQQSGSGGKSSSAGSSWAASSYPPYFWVSATTGSEIVDLTWKWFQLEGAWYMVQRVLPDNAIQASSSTLYLQGTRGNCDDNSAAKGTLIDATKSWVTDQWIGAKVKITAGPGEGEWRTITDNDGTTLTVDRNWNVTHTTSSEYAVYDTETWYAFSGSGNAPTTGDDAVPASFTVTDVEVVDDIAFFACGSNRIVQMRINSADGLHDFYSSDTATARLLKLFYHPDDGKQLWRSKYLTEAVSRASIPSYGANLSFGSDISIGSEDYAITGLIPYNDELWVRKADSLWRVKNDRPAKLDIGLDGMAALTNGLAACTQNLYLYFSFAHSVERMYGSTVDDMGPWKGAGMPSGRQGPVTALLPVLGWLFAAVDGGPSGTSSILVWNGRGWHEVFRAWESGRRIRSLAWLPSAHGKPKLYFSVGSTVVYLTFPQDTLNPLRDSAQIYQHEGYLVTSTFDMGTVRLPKLFKEFEFMLEGLRRGGSSSIGREVWLDAQFDEDIGSTTWLTMGVIEESPVDNVQVLAAGRRQARFRLRFNTNSNTTPIVGRGYVVEGFARTPVKYQYAVRVKVSHLQSNYRAGQDQGPSEFLNWLKQQAGAANKIRMHSIFPEWDDKLVIIEPPGIIRHWQNKTLGLWGGYLDLIVREV